MQLTVMAMLMVMMMKETSGEEMKQVPGWFNIVSVGPAGVWGTDDEDEIFYRVGTYSIDGAVGSSWVYVQGFLRQLDVGSNIVWGVDKYYRIYYRDGINCIDPTGTSWVRVDGELMDISVNPNGNVWGVNSHGHIYIRSGATNENPAGLGWKQIPGELRQISTGTAGVWGVNSNYDIYYRTGTFQSNDAEGTNWVQVPGMKLIHVSSASSTVIGVSACGKLYIREGMTKDNPTGTEWKLIRENDIDFFNVDSMSKSIWTTRIDYSIGYGVSDPPL